MKRLVRFAISAASVVPAQSAAAATLDEAIAAALAHTPEVAIADAGIAAAKGRVRQAASGRFPTATVSGTVGTGHLDPKGFFGLGAADVTPRAAEAGIEQPLFAGGRVAAAIAGAKAGLAASEAQAQWTRSDVVTATAKAYGDVIAAARLAQLHQQLVTQTAEIERQARLRYDAGESPSTDVAQAAARHAEARAGLARSEGARTAAGIHFRSLTGLVPVDLQPLPLNPPVPATLDEAMAAAMEGSPALAGAKRMHEAAKASARQARGEYWPTIGAFAEASTVRDQFFPDYRADSAAIGVRARWEVFSGGRTAGKVAEKNAEVAAASARVRAAELQLEEAVVAAFDAVRTALLVEKAADEQAAAAAQARDSVRHEVRVGMKPQLDLLDAEREAIAAAAAAEQARTDRIVAAYRLNGLLGRI